VEHHSGGREPDGDVQYGCLRGRWAAAAGLR
jgi:hypothetical protein